MPRKNPLAPEDREICARLLEWRTHLKLSRELIGGLTGAPANYIAQIEHGRVPVRYWLARNLTFTGHLSIHWFAVGEGPMMLQTPIPSAQELRISPRALLSTAYKTHLVKLPKSREIPRSQFRTYLDALAKDWELRIPYGRVRDLLDTLEESANRYLAAFPSDPAALAQREQQSKAFQVVDIASAVALRPESGSSPLTNVQKTGIYAPMRWTVESLLDAIRERTQERGKKAELARFVGVSLSRVSGWLSGDFAPNASATLKLLEWVTGAGVSQTKAPASATNTSKGKSGPKKDNSNDAKSRPRKSR